VGFVVDKVALGQVFLQVLRFLLPILIPPSAPHWAGATGQLVADVPTVLTMSLQFVRMRRGDKNIEPGTVHFYAGWEAVYL
jgi:hypothetical protein